MLIASMFERGYLDLNPLCFVELVAMIFLGVILPMGLGGWACATPYTVPDRLAGSTNTQVSSLTLERKIGGQ